MNSKRAGGCRWARRPPGGASYDAQGKKGTSPRPRREQYPKFFACFRCFFAFFSGFLLAMSLTACEAHDRVKIPRKSVKNIRWPVCRRPLPPSCARGVRIRHRYFSWRSDRPTVSNNPPCCVFRVVVVVVVRAAFTFFFNFFFRCVIIVFAV